MSMRKMMAIGLGIMLGMFLSMGTLYACGGMGQGGHDMGNAGGMMKEEGTDSHKGYQHSGQQQGQPIEKGQAKQLLEDYLNLKENPNIKLGEITEGQDYFEAEVVTTKNGALVDKIRVNKSTGSLESVYQGKPRAVESPGGGKGHRH